MLGGGVRASKRTNDQTLHLILPQNLHAHPPSNLLVILERPSTRRDHAQILRVPSIQLFAVFLLQLVHQIYALVDAVGGLKLEKIEAATLL